MCINYGRKSVIERLTRPLTNNEILKAKPQEKDFTLHDGDGHFLLVQTSGKKLWRFRYQGPNSCSRTNLSLGSYPALTLAVARQMRDQYLSLLAQGIDPQKQQEEVSEQRQIELDSIFQLLPESGFSLRAKALPRIMRRIFGDRWRKTSSLLSERFLFRRLRPERSLKHWSRLKLAGRLRQFAVWFSALTRS